MPCNLTVCVLNFNSLSVHQKKWGRFNLVLHFQFHVYNGRANIILNFFLVENKKGEGGLPMTDNFQYDSMKYTKKKKKKKKSFHCFLFPLSFCYRKNAK